MFDPEKTIQDIPWDQLPTIYGLATKVPEMVEALTTGDSSATREACLWLLNQLEHQDSVCDRRWWQQSR